MNARATLPGWPAWLVARLGSGMLTLLAISVLVFVATLALPSDPARVILGAEAPEASVAALRLQLGLDRPVALQYLGWLGRLLHGDLGVSLDSGVPVAQLLADRADNSLTLIALVLAIAVPLSVAGGLALAVRADSRIDRAALALLVIVKAVPSYILGIGLIVLLATNAWRLLPAVSLLDPARPAILQPALLALPALTLVLVIMPYLLRLVRTAAIEVLASGHVAAARLRGIPEGRIVRHHVLPNAILPLVQGIAMALRTLIGGSLLVETVFGFPGIGTALNTAVELRDVPVIQAIVLATAGFIVAVNLLADLATLWLTPGVAQRRRPRLRTGAMARLRLKAGQ